MTFELLLLTALIFVFIISFCGLLQKIKQSYERERIIAERLQRRQQLANSESVEVYVNSSYVGEYDGGVFPTSPPPYTFVGPPPKYEEVMKDQLPKTHGNATAAVTTTPNSTERAVITSSPQLPPPPLYTLT